MCNSKTHQKQNRHSAASNVLTFGQLELAAGSLDLCSFGPHLSDSSIGRIPPIGPVGPVLPIGPGPLVPIGLVTVNHAGPISKASRRRKASTGLRRASQIRGLVG
jgi:hypothetical protein